MIPRTVKRMFDERAGGAARRGIRRLPFCHSGGGTTSFRWSIFQRPEPWCALPAKRTSGKACRFNCLTAARLTVRCVGCAMGGWAYILPGRWSSRPVEMNFRMIKARIEEARDPSDRRRTSRHPVEIGARVRELGAEGFEARVAQHLRNRLHGRGGRRVRSRHAHLADPARPRARQCAGALDRRQARSAPNSPSRSRSKA